MTKKYILKNISQCDVLLSDLGHKIPAGKSVDLLAHKSMLTEEIIEKSRISGCLSKVMGKYLVRVEEIVKITTPLKTMSKNTNVVVFPQKTKSFITIEVGELTDEQLRNVASDEEAAFLEQLESDLAIAAGDSALPIAAKREDESGESET
jgi:hypothetical protein